MTPAGPIGDFLIDPLTGKPVGLNDQHYSVLSLYYRLLPVYDKEFNDAKDYYYNRTWHDYAILLLQTASFLNIKTRPPGFKPAPLPPTAHLITIDKDYKLRIDVVQVGQLPPDPDPAKQTYAPDPKDPNSYIIVNITQPIPFTPHTGDILDDSSVIVYLKSLSRDRVIAIFNVVMS